MTFKHKLSCRLALLRNVVLLGAVCAAAACDLQQLLGLLARVASVTVSPATASVGVGQTVSLAATPKDSTGNALTGRVVTWSSNSPTITATSEGQSGSATVTVTVVPPGSGGVVFESDWAAGEPSDGGRWANYWEFNNGTNVRLLSVVSGFGPGGRNALKVLQRGENLSADLQQYNIVPLSTDYYVRFYMRNDDTSPSGDHVVVTDVYEYWNLTYMRKSSGTSGWQFVVSMYGCGSNYPINHLGPTMTLSRGVWYRFEYFVDFVGATHVQVHPRVYDASGTQILGDADFRQSDYGSAVWNGRSDWTLASLYSAGYSFCVNPQYLQNFGVGN